MNERGQIIGGGLKDIVIREKNGENLELGELLIVENAQESGTERNYTILQVKDIEYKSQAHQSTHELLSGMKLEGYEPDLEFMEPELTNYIVGRAKSLLYVNENKETQKYITKSPKKLPEFFSPIKSIGENDLKFLKPENLEDSIYLGDIRSGSTVKEGIKVYIDLIKSLTHHILIPATTGRGKSNLVKVMLWSILDTQGAGILVLDPHNEYFGDNIRTGLRKHPKKDEKLEYYSPDKDNNDALSLSINVKKIRPYHFRGIGGFSPTQSEAMKTIYNKYKSKWITKIAKGINKTTLKEMGVQESTADVLKRKIETKLGVSSILDEDSDKKRIFYKSNLFIGGDSGISTVQNIVTALESEKIVVIDSSKLSDFEELFIGSIISSNIFNKYKNYNSKELKDKPVISIVIEEAPRVLGQDILVGEGGNNIYGTIAREGRKFKIGLIAITQLASVIPRAILANMNTKIILGNEMSPERSAIINSASQDLSDDDRIIASLDKGEAIVSSVFTRFAIPIYTPEFEKYVKQYLEKIPQDKTKDLKTMIVGWYLMYKFAHIADCHLGAQKYSELKELEIKAFNECLDRCMEEKVDFIIIAGDLFHSNLPDMGIVKQAVGKLKEVKDKGIPIYINYGSHDFSPNETSIIDVITESGLLKKLFNAYVVEDDNGKEKLKLEFVTDEKTGAKLTGISGRKIGLDDTYYEILDKKSLEEDEGFKIFVFHAAIKNLLPDFLSKIDGIDIRKLPKNFDYYAGGHIHKRICETNIDNYNIITYPGPPFAGYPRDLEMSAKGEKRGFFIVEFDEKIQNVDFCEVNIAEYENIPSNPPFIADHKNSIQLYDEIVDEIKKIDFDGKIVILKVKGELTGGKTSDINFHKIREILKESGALHVSINHHGLVSKEFTKVRVKGETTAEIEENLLLENISNIDVKQTELNAKEGAKLAINLLKTIRKIPKPNEKKADYNNRILNESMDVLDLESIEWFLRHYP